MSCVSPEKMRRAMLLCAYVCKMNKKHPRIAKCFDRCGVDVSVSLHAAFILTFADINLRVWRAVVRGRRKISTQVFFIDEISEPGQEDILSLPGAPWSSVTQNHYISRVPADQHLAPSMHPVPQSKHSLPCSRNL